MTPSMQAKLKSGLITLCRVWRITCTDGSVLRFTDHDSAITADALVFDSSALAFSAIEFSEGLEPSNFEVTGIFDDAGINIAGYLTGKYSMAKVEIGFADWADPLEPILLLLVGTIGEFKRDRLGFTCQIVGISRLINRSNAEATTPMCRARLGDARCKVPMALRTISTTITAVASQREFTVLAVSAINYLQYGICEFTSGPNIGRKIEIKAQLTGTGIELYLPMPFAVSVGDVVNLTAGCNLLLSTCHDQYNNVVNFRGEPYLPGADSMTENQKYFV